MWLISGLHISVKNYRMRELKGYRISRTNTSPWAQKATCKRRELEPNGCIQCLNLDLKLK